MNIGPNISRLMLGVITLTAVVVPAPGAMITWTNAAAAYWTNGVAWSDGTVPGPADDVVFSSGSAVVTIDQDVTINSLNITGTYAGTLVFATNIPANLTINNDLYLNSSAIIATPYSSLVGDGSGRIIVVGRNAVIDGTIDGDSQGWPAKNTNAPGYSSGQAAHGGRGSSGTALIYGSLTNAVALGSGSPEWGGVGRNGGGAIKLQVAGTLTINGTITMNGGSYGSSGSGGSIWLIADTLAGSGTIRANGGSGYGAAAGGGRISLEYGTSTFTGNVTLFGYHPGTLWEPKRFQALKGAPGSPVNMDIRSHYQYFLRNWEPITGI